MIRRAVFTGISLLPAFVLAQPLAGTAGLRLGGGIGIPLVQCADCDQSHGGFGLSFGIGGELAPVDRFAIGIEYTGTWVLFASSRNIATALLGTVAFSPVEGMLLRTGFGVGRYTLEPSRLVDDRPAWMLGVELPHPTREGSTMFIDVLMTAYGPSVQPTGESERYRYRLVRVGGVLRFPGQSTRSRRVAWWR